MRRDFGVTRLLRDFLPEWTTNILLAVSMLGDLVVIIPLLGVIYAADVGSTIYRSRDPPLCSDRTGVLIAVVLGGLSLVVVLESVFAMDRPPAELHALTPNEHGFPSGHTMAATIFWGAAAVWLALGQRAIRVTVAGLVVLFVAFSRLALGVHFLADVIIAIVFGILYLIIAAWIAKGNPVRGFGFSIAIAVTAVILTTGSTRAMFAFIGTGGATLGWWLIEKSGKVLI